MPRQQAGHRLKSQHSALQQAVVGNTGNKVSSGWKRTGGAQDRQVLAQEREADMSQSPANRRGPQLPMVGSKILMSQLPLETVHERDIEELFAETIGPVFSVFIIYNSSGRSKGMAVVNFQRRNDAAEARRKYNGKIIDGRRPLKIELIIDPPEGPARDRSLAARLGERPINGTFSSISSSQRLMNVSFSGPKSLVYRRGLRKGPRRPKKSVEQLDREMDAYMAEAPRITETDIKAAVENGQ